MGIEGFIRPFALLLCIFETSTIQIKNKNTNLDLGHSLSFLSPSLTPPCSLAHTALLPPHLLFCPQRQPVSCFFWFPPGYQLAAVYLFPTVGFTSWCPERVFHQHPGIPGLSSLLLHWPRRTKPWWDPPWLLFTPSLGQPSADGNHQRRCWVGPASA